ncbi:MAG: dienelactone hydrolase [Burkholderiaceae bacterium]|nr:dienelactone hydrolase [Burkholderiaceae bacterium]
MSSISQGRTHVQRLAAAWLLAACAPLTASAQVGMARAELAGLPVTLIYPTAESATRLVQGSFEIDVAVGAAPAPGPHRLVVMSHGTGGSALSDHTLAATLARAGFVVAQPRHAGDNHVDASKAGPAAWATRPREISAVIDALAASPTWQPLLQLDKVGVHGMSAGGGTALVMAGARWRVLDLARHCAAHADEDLGFCFNGTASPAARAERRASFERARGAPEIFLPSHVTQWHGGREGADPRPDPRVAAVSAAVPVAAIFTPESLAAIRIPVAIVGASRDQNLLPAFHSQRVLMNCGACVGLDELRGAGHFDLLAPWPSDVAQRVGAAQVRGGLPEPDFDPRLRQAAFDKIVAFFDRMLRP